MAITVDQAMEHLNADDDEREKVELALKHAQAMVQMEVYKNDGEFKSKDADFNSLREDMLDRVVLQALSNNYLHAEGDVKQNSNNSSSEDSLLSYTRVPSV